MRLSACLGWAAMLLASSGTLHAEHYVYGSLNGVGRFLGYGWGPGYHARELPTIQYEYAPRYFETITSETAPQPAPMPMQQPIKVGPSPPTPSAPLLIEEAPAPTAESPKDPVPAVEPQEDPVPDSVIPKTQREPTTPDLPSSKVKSSIKSRSWGKSIFGAAKPSSSKKKDGDSVR